MNDEMLQSLLLRADGGCCAVAIAPERIRLRARRGRAARRAGVISLLALMVAAVLVWRGSWKAVPGETPRVMAVRGAMPEVRSQIDFEAGLELARKHAQVSSAEWPDVDVARESAAQTLLFSAQRTLHAGDSVRGMRLLRETLTLFPETASAARAREALGPLQKPDEDPQAKETL